MPTVVTAFLYLNAFLTSFRICSSKKFIYSFKILCFRPLLISFTHQNSGADCIINMPRVRFAHLSRLDAIRTAKAMFVCSGHTITQRKKLREFFFCK